MRIRQISFVLVLLSLLSACNSSPVRPWQRGTLAKPQMQLPQTQLIGVLEDHVYFSKEAASGGYGAAAGGCGCN